MTQSSSDNRESASRRYESSTETTILCPLAVGPKPILPNRKNGMWSKERMQLFVHVRTLFRYLSKVDPPTFHRAKNVLRQCDREYSAGASVHATLADAIEEGLKEAVGEGHWTEAERIQRRMTLRRRRSVAGNNGGCSTSSSAPTAAPSMRTTEREATTAAVPSKFPSEILVHSNKDNLAKSLGIMPFEDDAIISSQGSITTVPSTIAFEKDFVSRMEDTMEELRRDDGGKERR